MEGSKGEKKPGFLALQTNQIHIRENYNLLWEALGEDKHDELSRLDEKGYCAALSLHYLFYSYAGCKNEFFSYLKFIASLTPQKIEGLVKYYNDQNKKDFWCEVEGSTERVLFSKLLKFVEGIHNQQSRAQHLHVALGAKWDRNVSFMGRTTDELTKKLREAHIAVGDLIFVGVGRFHGFAIERVKEGFYVFEPNNIVESKLLPSEEEVAAEIHRNLWEEVAAEIRPNVWGLGESFLLGCYFFSFGDKNSELDDALDQHKEVLDIFEPLIDLYRKGILSRLDLALEMKRKMLSSSFKSNPRLLELHTTLEKFIHNHHYHPPVISVKEATQSAYYGKHQSYWLPMAVQMGQIDCVRNLLEKGADPNSIDYGGETSLCIAIKIGYAPVVKILLERGANPNVENLKGESPLALAVQAKRNDLVELLLKRGASPFIPYSPVLQSILGKGRHMVGMAIEENDIEILQVVLENISSIPQEILDKALANVLLKNTEEGANKNHIEMAELLLSKGAKIDEYNVTMMKSNLLLVSLPFLLKENGHAAHIDQNKLGSLDVLLKDEDFKKFLGTPLGSALCRGNVRAVQWLIAHGVEHQKNIAGKTMEELADILGKGEVRDFFRQLNVMPPSPLQRGP